MEKKQKVECVKSNIKLENVLKDTSLLSTVSLASFGMSCIPFDLFSGSIIALSSVLPGLLYMHVNEKITGDKLVQNVYDSLELYNGFVKEYVKLNQTFEMKHPLEMFYLYNTLRSYGYLSKDKKFQYDRNDCHDVPYLFGAEIMKGTGVCRHIAHFLSDVYHLSGVEEDLVSVIVKNGEQKDIHQSNHVLNFVAYKNNVYFLDPTSCIILKKEENNLVSSWLNNPIKIEENKELYNGCQTTLCEDREILLQASKKYQENEDILEKFYKDNKCLYEEMSDRLESSKKILTRNKNMYDKLFRMKF